MNMKNAKQQSIDTLIGRFNSRHDTTNTLHKSLQAKLNDIATQLNAVEVIRLSNADAATKGRAVEKLKNFSIATENWLKKTIADTNISLDNAARLQAGMVAGPYGAEIRQRLHEMKPGDKIKAVMSLIQARDGASLSAVLDSPALLTGLSTDEIGKFKAQYYEVACPDIVQAANTFKELADTVDAGVRTALSAAREYSNPDGRDVQAKAKALDAANAQLAGGSNGN